MYLRTPETISVRWNDSWFRGRIEKVLELNIGKDTHNTIQKALNGYNTLKYKYLRIEIKSSVCNNASEYTPTDDRLGYQSNKKSKSRSNSL